MQRQRLPSQRKRIKKSLGPDFLDPSHIRETRDSKCMYCHTSSQSQEELVSCSKCEFRSHPSCFRGEHCFELSSSTDWVCFYCSLNCLICKKHLQESYEPSVPIKLCVECKNGFHVSCLRTHSSYRSTFKLSVKGPFMCNKCTHLKSKSNREANGVHTQPKVTRRGIKKESMCSSVTIEMNGLDDDDDDVVVKEEDVEEETEDLKDDKEEENEHSSIESKSGSRTERDSVDWTIDDVADFIRDSGFPEEALLFKQQEIDGRSLLLLQRTDVLTGLSMKLGPALKIFARIYQLQMTRFQSLCSDQSSSESSSFAVNCKSDTSKVCAKLPELVEYERCKTINL